MFLRKVSAEAGLQMAILCAVALGRTTVKNFRDRVRVDLPFEIQDRKSSWESSVIEQIIREETQNINSCNVAEITVIISI